MPTSSFSDDEVSRLLRTFEGIERQLERLADAAAGDHGNLKLRVGRIQNSSTGLGDVNLQETGGIVFVHLLNEGEDSRTLSRPLLRFRTDEFNGVMKRHEAEIEKTTLRSEEGLLVEFDVGRSILEGGISEVMEFDISVTPGPFSNGTRFWSRLEYSGLRSGRHSWEERASQTRADRR